MGFRLIAGAIASCAFIGVAVGVGLIYGSLLVSIGRNPSQRDELLRYSFIGFSLVEVSGLIGLVISLLLLFGFSESLWIRGNRAGVECRLRIYTYPSRYPSSAQWRLRLTENGFFGKAYSPFSHEAAVVVKG